MIDDDQMKLVMSTIKKAVSPVGVGIETEQCKGCENSSFHVWDVRCIYCKQFRIKKAYKYRGGSQTVFERDLDAICNDVLWAPTPTALNDPCEGFASSDFVYDSVKVILRGAAYKHKREAMLQGLDRIIQGSKTMGVYSLSETPLDELLWAHYGNSHSGFCIEYDLEPLALGASYADKWMEKFGRTNTLNCFRVQYQNDVPEIHPGAVGSVNDECYVFQTLLGYKSSRWSYEREIRLITPCSGVHKYSQKVVTGIYFGLRMPEDQITVLLQRLKGRHITYYQTELSSGSYGLTAKKLFTT